MQQPQTPMQQEQQQQQQEQTPMQQQQQTPMQQQQQTPAAASVAAIVKAAQPTESQQELFLRELQRVVELGVGKALEKQAAAPAAGGSRKKTRKQKKRKHLRNTRKPRK
jgi:hypothetical protein